MRICYNSENRLCDDLSHTIQMMVSALDERCENKGHSNRVTKLALAVAQKMQLSPQTIRQMYWGALLHDIGKIRISDQILQKPGPLNANEWDEVRLHPIHGYELLEPIANLDTALSIVLHHHEQYDGKGYPAGKKGNEIPLIARIFCVVDAYDAMTNQRSYKHTMTHENAIEEIKAQAGKQFDLKIVQGFLEVSADFAPISVDYPD
jgi:HD-GYP domain-containing protein (c-di-GMP phosphodiesterase class II)